MDTFSSKYTTDDEHRQGQANYQADHEHMTAFLHTLLGEGLPDGTWAHVWHLNGKLTDWVRTVPEAERAARSNGRRNVYFGVGLVAEPGASDERVKNETAVGLLGVATDIDIAGPCHKNAALPPDLGAAQALVDEAGAPATLIIDTGHGVQAWWLFRAPLRFTTAEDKQRTLDLARAWHAHMQRLAERHGWKLDNVSDVARVLRIPGTLNAKDPEHVVPVRLLELDDGYRYTSEELWKICGGAESDGGERTHANGAHERAGAQEPHEDVKPSQRYTAEHPCPICDGDADLTQGIGERCWGFRSSYVDGAFCTREDWAGKILDEAVEILGQFHWFHALHGECDCGETHNAGEADQETAQRVRPMSATERRLYALGYTPNDIGNARRFVNRFGRDFRWVVERQEWVYFDGVWTPSTKGAVETAMRAATQAILRDAWSIPNTAAHDKARKAWIAWAGQSGMGVHLDRALKIARTMRDMSVSETEFDTHPLLLACPNGYLDLATDEFTPREKFGLRERALLITKLTKATYDPDARSDVLDETFPRFMPDAAMRSDFVTALGYSATGRAKEHAFFCVGGTKTGKSTIVNMFKNALGDYAKTADMETFMSGTYGRGGGTREDLVALVGRRMVLASENNENARVNSALLKRMSGNDEMSMRANYGKQFEALPTYAIWLLTNEAPKVAADDSAVWERVHVFRFTEYIAPEDRDETKRDQVVDTAVTGSAALNLIVQGWRRLRDELHGRLALPTTDTETQTYRSAQDLIEQFIGECCDVAPEHSIRFAEFKNAFRRYLWHEGVKEQYTDQRIGRVLKAKGYTVDAEKPHERTYRGLQLNVAVWVDQDGNMHFR
jgi:P4 family phage/plasmid primase-like protien